jgi:hypothetical protein
MPVDNIRQMTVSREAEGGEERPIQLDDSYNYCSYAQHPKEKSSSRTRYELQSEIVEDGGEDPSSVDLHQDIPYPQAEDGDPSREKEEPPLHMHTWKQPLETGTVSQSKPHPSSRNRQINYNLLALPSQRAHLLI